MNAPEFMRAAVDGIKAGAGFGAVPADVVLAQSALETGNWSSRRFLEDHNAFGMRMPRQRATNAIGETSDGFAIYANAADSVSDYFARQRAFRIPNTSDVNAYMAATVRSGYAPEFGYLNAWRARLGDASLDPGNGSEVVSSTSPLLVLALVGLPLFLLSR